ncbi:hypothetical protein AZE42_06460 [Rhizopogon vesiculosus]|uniref:Uncharacterized protein n=1 Tax=Rhizopogon vesiculosus TaxID=180088 RepID=A0A1J8QDH0_9AGAM|nr:hypothetical protein AZE42_06460 [Rhizopogon vesiculosus]
MQKSKGSLRQTKIELDIEKLTIDINNGNERLLLVQDLRARSKPKAKDLSRMNNKKGTTVFILFGLHTGDYGFLPLSSLVSQLLPVDTAAAAL